MHHSTEQHLQYSTVQFQLQYSMVQCCCSAVAVAVTVSIAVTVEQLLQEKKTCFVQYEWIRMEDVEKSLESTNGKKKGVCQCGFDEHNFDKDSCCVALHLFQHVQLFLQPYF